MAVNPDQWPRTGRRSIAAQDVACALLKAARYTLDLDDPDADAKRLWEQISEPRDRASLLELAERCVDRAEWWVEERQYDRQRAKFGGSGKR